MPDPTRGRNGDSQPMPVFVVKARDALAVPTLRAYQQECLDHGLKEQAAQVGFAISEIVRWQDQHIEQTKLPDHQHVPAGRPGSGSET